MDSILEVRQLTKRFRDWEHFPPRSRTVLDGISRGIELTDRPTRYGQALRTAEKFALDAGAGRRVIHLISDFQKTGIASDEQDLLALPVPPHLPALPL